MRWPRSILPFPLLAALVLLVPSPAYPASTAPNANTTPPPTLPPTDPTPPPTAGDPVGVIDGAVLDAATDVRVSCPGIDLVFRRSYCSMSAVTSPLGYGWTHAYETWVEERDGKTHVHVSGESGVSDVVRDFGCVEPGCSERGPNGSILVRASDGRYAYVSPEGTRYAFNAFRKLESVTTWDGHSVTLVRDSPSGPVVRAVHSCGKALSFSYGAEGELLRVNTPDAGVRVDFAYAQLCGRRVLASVVRRDGPRASTNAYEYASVPRPAVHYVEKPSVHRVAPRECVTALTGLPPSAASGGGAQIHEHRPTVQPVYPLVGTPTHVVLARKRDANGIGTSYSYGRATASPFAKCEHAEMTGGLMAATLRYGTGMTAVSRPTAGGASTYELRYDSKRRETLRQTGSERRERTYTAAGDLVRETLSDAATGRRFVVSSGYAATRRVSREGTAYGGVPLSFWQFSWDDRRGIPNGIVSPEGRVWEWRADGHDVSVFGAGAGDPRLVSRVLCTDADRPYALITPDGGRTDISYDRSGYVTNVVATGLPAVAFAHDALGHVSSLALPGPAGTTRTVSFVTNGRGRPLSVSRPDGTAESFAYDGNGTKVVSHIDALGREDVYRWTLGLPVHAGRVINGVTNALFAVSHDRQLNVIAITDPLGRPAESYVLDLNERVVAVTNLEGQAMTRTYALGEMVASETRFDGTSVAYGYDSGANLASVAYPDDTLRFGYDRDGLMTSAANASGTVSNRYDAATGWLDSSVGADGSAVSYFHSNDGSVTGVVSVAGAMRHVLDVAGRRVRTDSPAGTVRYGHCPWNGRVAAVMHANGVTATYEYDIMNRVTNIAWRTASGSRLGGFAYRYDALGRIVSRAHDLGGASFDRDYAYDGMDRLASDGGTAYAYDAAGNRMTRTEDGETVTYSLGAGDRLATWTGGSYRYDAAGCVTRITRGADTWDLTWNGQYQLVSVSTNGTFAESYSYDALGRRVTTRNAEGTERHVYDDSWQVIADLDEDGNVLRSYVWGEGIDRILAVKIGSKTYTALTDVQGTVWGYADEQGDVVARWTYDAWGNVLSEEVDVSAAELRAVRYRFQGRERSAATGLTNFRMRWYDAETGRWLSKDPIGLSGGLNLYESFGNKPNVLTDPFGLWTFQVGISGTGGAGNGATVGVGFALGRSPSGQWQLGVYYTGGDGAYISKGGGVSVDFTWSPNGDICDLEGVGQTVGGSGTTPLGSIGGEGSFPLPTGDGPLPYPSVSGSWGVSTPLPEAHTFTTITGIADIWRW